MTRTQLIARPRTFAAFAIALLLASTVLAFGVAARADAVAAGNAGQLPVGAWVLEGNPAITLEVGADGAAAGTGGVNRFGTTFEVGADGLTVGPVISTMMAGGEAEMAAEHAFLVALQDVTGFEVAGGTLTLVTGDGAQLVLVPAA